MLYFRRSNRSNTSSAISRPIDTTPQLSMQRSEQRIFLKRISRLFLARASAICCASFLALTQ